MNKKKLVIIIFLILVLLVSGYLFKDKLFGSKDDKLISKWGDIYYVYLKDIKAFCFE